MTNIDPVVGTSILANSCSDCVPVRLVIQTDHFGMTGERVLVASVEHQRTCPFMAQHRPAGPVACDWGIRIDFLEGEDEAALAAEGI